MYKNVLVAVEPTHAEKHEQALTMARSLADPTAEITALTVIEPVPGYFPKDELPHDLKVQAGEHALGELRRFVGPRSEINTVLLHGQAANKILEYALNHDIDCIIVASHKPGLTDYLLGSTAARVVRHAKCSVHVMR